MSIFPLILYFHDMQAKLKHPSGLPFLFFAEMWERFGYYLMLGIFTMYLEDLPEKGGFGMDTKQSADIYGTFIALVFLTPFIGGLLADRKIGYSRSITLGGILMGIGYCLLAIKGLTVFYIALTLIILGNGFFKPNISTLLGNLYNEDKYKSLKDAGFSIFYMGINVGAFICNFFAATLRNSYGWGAAFLCAGLGMFLGVIIFWIGMKHYKHADVVKPVKPGDQSLQLILGTTILPAIIAGCIGWLIPGNVFGSDSTDAFIVGALPVVVFYFTTWKRASIDEKKPIGAMLAIFAVVIIFWAVFKQNGTALTTWANKYTDREMPAAIGPSLTALKFAKSEKFIAKDSVPLTDRHFRKQKDAEGKTILTKAYPDYFKNYNPQNLPANGESVQTINPEIFQSVNPGWVVLLTFPIVWVFAWLKRHKREPTTASKIAIGLGISALSTLVMVAAVYTGSNGAIKVSPLWIIGAYGVITIGELCLSPMGLSLVSKLSPPRLTALMMGGWFLATSIGNKLSGILASLWDSYDNKANFFLINFALLTGATLLMVFMLKRLNTILKNYDR